MIGVMISITSAANGLARQSNAQAEAFRNVHSPSISSSSVLSFLFIISLRYDSLICFALMVNEWSNSITINYCIVHIHSC